MKWAVRIIIAVVLGAVINVGVAWGCACWSETHKTHKWMDLESLPTRVRSVIPQEWLIIPDSEPEIIIYTMTYEYSGVGVRYHETDVSRSSRGSHTVYGRLLEQVTSGWPMKTLSYTAGTKALANLPWDRDRIPAPAWLRPISHEWVWKNKMLPFLLPLSPLWTGAVVNTAFYAALILLLWRGTALLRRDIRARAGRCPSCGYNRKGLASPSTPCPECGAAPTPAPVAEVRG